MVSSNRANPALLSQGHSDLEDLSVSKTTGVSSELLIRGPLECSPVLPTEQERQQILDKARYAVMQLIEHGRGITFAPNQCAFGIEVEFSLVQRKDGHLAKGSARRVAKLIQSENIHNEAGTASVEIATPAFLSRPGAYASLLNNLKATYESVRTAAAMCGWTPVCTGIPQILDKGELNHSGMLNVTNQIAMEQKFWEKAARKTAEMTGIPEKEDPGVGFKVRGSDKTAYHFDDEITVWTGMNSVHVTSGTRSHDHAVNLYNAYVALTPVLMGISANAGSINGQQLEAKDVRPYLAAWSKEDIRYDQKYSFGTIVQTIECIEDGFLRVIPDKPTVVCPSIQLTSGAEPNARDCFETIREITYPSIQLRFSNQDPRQILIEYRPMSVQLTPEDNVALAMFARISAEYLASNTGQHYQATARMINNDIHNTLRDGMDGKVVDILVDQSQYARRKRVCAADLALRIMNKAVEWHLAQGRINQDDVAVLAPLRERLVKRESCADTVAKTIKEKGLLQGVLSLS